MFSTLVYTEPSRITRTDTAVKCHIERSRDRDIGIKNSTLDNFDMIYYFILIAVVFLAYTNGANDNFKGVATLFGSGTTNYKKAIHWATITTVAGSITSIFLASVLIKNFSGEGLLPDSLINTPEFIISVVLGAALTIFMATKIGMPISTTHGLVGALTGVGILVARDSFNTEKLAGTFFLPLIITPVIAAIFSILLYSFFTKARKQLGVTKDSCVCVGEATPILTSLHYNQEKTNITSPSSSILVTTGTLQSCSQTYQGHIFGISAQHALDNLHFISAGAVSFARGLNDTPKMLGLLLIVNSLNMNLGAITIAVAIALGGLLNARKVAETMSKKITSMNHGQGFTANFVTAILVIISSIKGLPVSTTHVSVGSLFGIGTVSKTANTKVISGILLSWVLTLPVAAVMSAIIYLIVKQI